MEGVPRISGYELIQSHGGGPFTEVWFARELATDAPVAIKVPRLDSPYRDTALSLLGWEAHAGRAVWHPHLVHVRSDHTRTSPHFLTMDWIAGESLRARLRRDFRLPLPAALGVARQVAEALAALHRAGFVHGDVKPENIRLTDRQTAILIDLGFVHRPDEATRTQEGLLLGTANYLAPEACAPDALADDKADLFSLGVTLFEMLTGRLPYPPGGATRTLEAHRTQKADDLRQEPGAWPPALSRLLNRLLSRYPIRRPIAAVLVSELMALEIATLERGAA